MTALIVGAVVASTLAMSTSRFQRAVDTRDHRAAVALAHNELQRQLALSQSQPLWRTLSSNDLFSSWRSGEVWMGGGRVRHRYTDNDGDLQDDPADPVKVTVHATVGRAEAAIEADLDVATLALPALSNSVTCGNDFTVQNASQITCVRGIAAGDDVRAESNCRIASPYVIYFDETSGAIAGDTLQGDVELPTSDLLELYSQSAITIQTNSLATRQSQRILDDEVLSSTFNPFGAAGSVYYLELNDTDIVIENSRVEATLVIENASEIIFRQGNIILGDPMSHVSIITDSPITVEDWKGELSESDVGANFNPASCPWNGQSDSDTSDTYRSILSGLFYTTDNIKFTNRSDETPVRARGCFIGNDVFVQTHTTIEKLDELVLTPPLGFVEVQNLFIQPRSLRSILSP